MSIQLPVGLQCDPVQMAELRQKVPDAWDNLPQNEFRHLYDRLHHSAGGVRDFVLVGPNARIPRCQACVNQDGHHYKLLL